MTLLFRAVVVVLLLGPQVGTFLVPSQEVCEETSDCCTPQGVCDVNCVTCACCAGRLTNFSSSPAIEPVDLPSGAATTAARSVTLPLLSTDIFHVPKSV